MWPLCGSKRSTNRDWFTNLRRSSLTAESTYGPSQRWQSPSVAWSSWHSTRTPTAIARRNSYAATPAALQNRQRLDARVVCRDEAVRLTVGGLSVEDGDRKTSVSFFGEPLHV